MHRFIASVDYERCAGRVARVCLCLVAGLACMDPVFAEPPRTLYRPADIENARANIERYEWAREIRDAWQREVAPAMRWDRDAVEAFIPDFTLGTLYRQVCPHCILVHGRSPARSLAWSIGAPDRVRCNACGTTYPHAEYPETLVVEAPRMGQTFTYYQTPTERALGPEADAAERARHALNTKYGRPFGTSFSGLIRFSRARWAWERALTLAQLYVLTGEVAYAERTAWIVDRFARVFPNYLYRSYFGDIADAPPAEVAAAMGSGGDRFGGRFPLEVIRHAYASSPGWARWGLLTDEQGNEFATMRAGFFGAGRLDTHTRTDGGPLRDLIVAYDLTRGARHADGTPVYREAMHRRIIDDLIIAGADDVAQWETVNNKGVAVYSVNAAAGLLLDDPARVRHAIAGFQRILDTAHHFDGFHSESPGYAHTTFSQMMGLPDMLRGYSDPQGYIPAQGPRLDAYDPFAAGPFELTLLAMLRGIAPGYYRPVIGSTSPGSRLSPHLLEVLAARIGDPYPAVFEAVTGESLSERGGTYSLWYRDPDLGARGESVLPLRTEWFPGWHVGVLRGGRVEQNDTALYLVGNEHSWTVHTTHRHRDILSMIYYAYGEELLSDRDPRVVRPASKPEGWGQWHPWVMTHTHNLVVVDEWVQSPRAGWQGSQCGSHLELFGVAPGIEMIQASGFNVYRQCDEYRRTLAQIQRPDGRHYVVDFFRVRGGRVHQYTLHCNGTLESMHPAQPEPEPVTLSKPWRLWLDNARTLAPEEPATFTWEHRGIRLDLMLLNDPAELDRLIIADAPGERREPLGTRPPIQQILAERRRAEDAETLASRYAAVIVPYRSEVSPVQAARLLASCGESGALAVEVRLEGRTDYIVSALDGEERAYGPVTVAGRFAVVSVDDDGAVVNAYLLGGTRLAYEGRPLLELEQATTTLPVAGVAGRTYHLAAPLEAGAAETAWYVLAAGPLPLEEDLPRPRTGFEIESWTSGTITVRDYPVVACDEITLLHAAFLPAPARAPNARPITAP